MCLHFPVSPHRISTSDHHERGPTFALGFILTENRTIDVFALLQRVQNVKKRITDKTIQASE